MKKTLSLTALVLSLAASATQAAPASPSEAIKIATNDLPPSAVPVISQGSWG